MDMQNCCNEENCINCYKNTKECECRDAELVEKLNGIIFSDEDTLTDHDFSDENVMISMVAYKSLKQKYDNLKKEFEEYKLNHE